MPGPILHLIAGSAMFIIGRYYFKSYFDEPDKAKKLLLLAGVCLIFSIIPDFFLIIYYTTYIFSYCELLPYHDLLFFISGPIAIIGLLILKFRVDIKAKPVWIMGMWCILLHVTMDLFIPDMSLGILEYPFY
jgi:hypothetical protein